MARPRLGVICAEYQGAYQSKLIQGITSCAADLGYDTIIFGCFRKGYTDSSFENGEQVILKLPQWDLLDGVIVLGDTIRWPGALDSLIQTLEKHCSAPVVFIDYTKGHHFDNVTVDDAKPFQTIVEHLVECHGCKDILFFSGPETISSTVPRLKGYRQGIAKYGLSENVELTANYLKRDGVLLSQEIIDGKRTCPDAIIFSGDAMAVGAVETFKAAGYEIPDDIIIIGFDGTDEAILCTPPITSYSPPVEAAGANAVRLIDARLHSNGKIHFCKDFGKLEIGNSCGCTADPDYINRIFQKKDEDSCLFRFLQSNMMEDLTGATDLTSLMDIIQYYLYLVPRWDDFYLCLNDNWCEDASAANAPVSDIPYTDTMIMHIMSENRNNRTMWEEFPLKDLLPALHQEHKKPKIYYFTPIHQGTRSFGYCVIGFNENVSMIDDGYMNWCRHLSNAIEFYRLNYRISVMAITDTLTGVYSRAGLMQQINHINLRKHNPSSRCMVLEADVDGLKYVNDTFGHVAGDTLLKLASDCLKKAVGENEALSRTGGDEFVIYGCNCYSDDVIATRISQIEEAVKDINASVDLPYKVSISCGGVLTDIGEEADVDKMIKDADVLMYEMKTMHHKNRKE